MTLIRSEPGRVWRVTLDRPTARNAISEPMLADFLSALGDAAAHPEARVVLISGEGPHFCAGADLAELDDEVGAGPGSGGFQYERAFESVLAAIAALPVPVLARIQGAAVGAGCQLAVACDLAVAASDARLGIPAARLGILINFENVQRLVLSVGSKRAAEMLFTGRELTGEQAAAWGLVTEAFQPEELDERVEEMAEQIASAAPLSVRGAKRGIRAVLDRLSVDRETEGHRVTNYDMMAADAFTSEDLREGVRALRERRRPQFRGK